MSRRSLTPGLAKSPAKDGIDISVIVVNYNTADLFGRMHAALEAASTGLKTEIIVVDNASPDGSARVIRSQFPKARVIENPVNAGFARANNLALAYASGRYLLLLNTDAFVSPDTLQKTIEFMDGRPDCGVLGVKLIGSDGCLQPSCRYFPTPWNVFLARTGFNRFFRSRLVDEMSWDHASVRECDWVPGCYYLVRRETVEDVGLFDPRYFLYYEEVDHCRAVRQAGWRVVYYPHTQVVHIGGESAETVGQLTESGRQLSLPQIESELLYFRKHYGILGLTGAVVLNVFGDLIKICSSLLRRLDRARATTAIHHSWNVLKLLVDTNLASRATR